MGRVLRYAVTDAPAGAADFHAGFQRLQFPELSAHVDLRGQRARLPGSAGHGRRLRAVRTRRCRDAQYRRRSVHHRRVARANERGRIGPEQGLETLAPVSHTGRVRRPDLDRRNRGRLYARVGISEQHGFESRGHRFRSRNDQPQSGDGRFARLRIRPAEQVDEGRLDGRHNRGIFHFGANAPQRLGDRAR